MQWLGKFFFDIIQNTMHVHINSKKDYILYMGKNRIYGSNVEIITTKIYEVYQYSFCIWKPNHLTTTVNRW
jgi:spore coat polysaccharide biosynthesis protein SpsF (cytidylyltransferase family)